MKASVVWHHSLASIEPRPLISRAGYASWGLSLSSVYYNMEHIMIMTLSKAYLTKDTRLTRLSTCVNRTYNRTNRGLIGVTLGPFECIRECRNRFFKLNKNGTGVTSVCDRICSRTRPRENAWDRMNPCIYNRKWCLLHECTYPCI